MSKSTAATEFDMRLASSVCRSGIVWHVCGSTINTVVGEEDNVSDSAEATFCCIGEEPGFLNKADATTFNARDSCSLSDIDQLACHLQNSVFFDRRPLTVEELISHLITVFLF